MAGRSSRRMSGCGWPTPTEGDAVANGHRRWDDEPIGKSHERLAVSPFAWQAAFLGSGEEAS